MAFALNKADKVFLDFLRVRDQNLPEFASLKSSSTEGQETHSPLRRSGPAISSRITQKQISAGVCTRIGRKLLFEVAKKEVST